MVNVPEDIERLIVRRLDRANNDDDELRLNRELIRDPGARRLYEEYERNDAMAAAVLQSAFGGNRLAFDPAVLASAAVQRLPGVSRQAWWLWAGAAVAAMLAIVVARVPLPGSNGPGAVRTDGVPGLVSNDRPRTSDQPSAGSLWNVSTPRQQLPAVKRHTGREVFGVMGEDGNVYWIEVDRTRTLKRPGQWQGGETPPT